jgi:hypothetical protein
VSVAQLEGQGKTIVEVAGHYADEDALYVSAANRADGEPATEDDANAYVIQRNWQGTTPQNQSSMGGRNSVSPRATNATTVPDRHSPAR